MNRLSMLLFNGGRCLTCARAGAGTVVSAVTRRLGRPRLLREFTSQTAAANSPACSQMKSIVDKDHLEHLLSHNSGEFVLVDVREREEIARDGKIPSSVNIPVAELENALLNMSNTEFKAAYGRNKVSKMDNIIFYCRGGSRSSMAYEMSMDAGFTRAQNFIGGWLSWSDCQEGGCHVRVYIDMQSTTPMDPRVIDKMLPYLTTAFGNPHSSTHSWGWDSGESIQSARRKIALLLKAQTKEIIFTSGATESNNLTLKGIARHLSNQKRHIITTNIEHKCILQSCKELEEKEGFDVTYLPVNSQGLISIKQLEDAIRPDTCLVSIMAVNNEVGAIQPLEEIGRICKEKNVLFHTDAAQAVGKIPLDVDKMNIDLMSISAHKFYGPKGVGCLYLSNKKNIQINAMLSGGGQERGLRSGTLATPLVVGMGEACEVANQEMNYDSERIKKLSERLLTGIQTQLEGVYRNGGNIESSIYPGCVNLSFEGVKGDELMVALKEIALSAGSACSSSSSAPSYVLMALGVPEHLAKSSLRFGIGRFTSEQEIDFVIDRVVKHVRRLRSRVSSASAEFADHKQLMQSSA